MNINQRLTTLERQAGTNDQERPPLLLEFFNGRDDTGESYITDGGTLYVYKPNKTAEYRLTAEQVDQYKAGTLDLSQLPPHKVATY